METKVRCFRPNSNFVHNFFTDRAKTHEVVNYTPDGCLLPYRVAVRQLPRNALSCEVHTDGTSTGWRLRWPSAGAGRPTAPQLVATTDLHAASRTSTVICLPRAARAAWIFSAFEACSGSSMRRITRSWTPRRRASSELLTCW